MDHDFEQTIDGPLPERKEACKLCATEFKDPAKIMKMTVLVKSTSFQHMRGLAVCPACELRLKDHFTNC